MRPAHSMMARPTTTGRPSAGSITTYCESHSVPWLGLPSLSRRAPAQPHAESQTRLLRRCCQRRHSRAGFGADGELKAGDATILQDRDVDVRDE